MYYTLKDHQGSLTANVHGNTVERLSYDAWSRRRNPVGFGYNNVAHTFDRGYTLHEHYDDFGLINMNGRLYDPVIGRMLSPDIAIQDEHNAQAYNRYSYCFNNPLRFTDPSGYVVEDDWYVDEKGRVIWDDKVTSVLNTPKGGVYIGPDDKDILRYYGLLENYGKKNRTKIGFSLNGVRMEYDHNGNLYQNQSPGLFLTFPVDWVESYMTTSVEVSFNTDEASGIDKAGKIFEGISFNFFFSQTSLSFDFQGYASVYYGDNLKEGHLEYRDKASIETTGYQYKESQIFIPAEDIKTKDTFVKAQIRAGAVNANLLFGPRPVKMIWDLTTPIHVANHNNYTFKYYFLHEK